MGSDVFSVSTGDAHSLVSPVFTSHHPWLLVRGAWEEARGMGGREEDERHKPAQGSPGKSPTAEGKRTMGLC